MQAYLDLMRHVLENGTDKPDRTGTGTLSVFGYQMRFDLAQGFPLLTTKKLHVKSIVHELLWFLAGDTNIAYLKKNGISIWNEWADAEGDPARFTADSGAPGRAPRAVRSTSSPTCSPRSSGTPPPAG